MIWSNVEMFAVQLTHLTLIFLALDTIVTNKVYGKVIHDACLLNVLGIR